MARRCRPAARCVLDSQPEHTTLFQENLPRSAVASRPCVGFVCALPKEERRDCAYTHGIFFCFRILLVSRSCLCLFRETRTGGKETGTAFPYLFLYFYACLFVKVHRFVCWPRTVFVSNMRGTDGMPPLDESWHPEPFFVFVPRKQRTDSCLSPPL